MQEITDWCSRLIAELMRSDWLPAWLMAAAALAYLIFVMWRLHYEQIRQARRWRAYMERRADPDPEVRKRAAREILELARQRLQERRRHRS